MQESFTEEPFKALMMVGAMTSMPNPVGAAASTESKSRDADELERWHKQLPRWLGRPPLPTLHADCLHSSRPVAWDCLSGMPTHRPRCDQPRPGLPCAAATGDEGGAAPALAPSLGPALQGLMTRLCHACPDCAWC